MSVNQPNGSAVDCIYWIHKIKFDAVNGFYFNRFTSMSISFSTFALHVPVFSLPDYRSIFDFFHLDFYGNRYLCQ